MHMHALRHVKSCFSHFIKEPCHTRFQGEDADEKILLLLRRHLVTNVPWIAFSILMIFAPQIVVSALKYGGIYILSFLPERYWFVLTIFWYLITFIFVFESYLVWFFNVYIVTNKRVVDVDFHGIFSREVSDAPISQVQDVTYNIGGIFAVSFNYGNVLIQTAGEYERLEFEYVPNPAYVQNMISDLATGVKKHGGK